jgi:glycosyltransferase involved in cell wall biosynthesis
MILLTHPTANQNVRQTALALADADVLAEFWTCVNWRHDSLVDRSLGLAPRVRSELRRRSFPEELAPFLRTHGWREWGRQLAGQLGWSRLLQDENALFSVDAVYLSLDRRVARRLATASGLTAVYAYDAGALATFHEAKRRGLKCIYEHPIIYWRKVRELQREEAELRPDWAPTLGALADSEAKLARKDEELALADLVVTASSFSKDSLAAATTLRAPVRVIPYGTNVSTYRRPPKERGEPLRVLFVGSLTQAKGLAYLFDAVAQLAGAIEFTLIGRRVNASVPSAELLEKHRWIPSLAHAELLAEMARHDVLVLPSLHEGFGLVLSEAMSQGLAIITTAHTAGPDLITDGVEGFIVPIRSAAAIEEKLALLAHDRERRVAMQEAAARKAATLTWENYRQAIVQVAREVVEKEATP